jgi:aminopeptidase N
VKKPYTAFSDGATLRRWEEGDLACAEFAEEKPINIPVVIAGKYTTKSEERSGVTVRVSSYAMGKSIAEKKITGIVFNLLDFYTHYLGPFPFKEINIIEINQYGFGQAPAGLIRITKEAFNPYEDEVANVYSQGINQRLAHELAHTWWGHVAKLGRMENVWMSESLAEYFSWYALDNVWEKGKLEEGTRQWKRFDDFVGPKGTVFMAGSLSGSKGPREYQALAYAHGPRVLAAFRKEVGDNAFFTICKSYLKNFAWKPAETKDFIGLTNFITKKDWNPWFEAHLMGTTPPEK